MPSTDKLFMPEQRARATEILTNGGKSFNLQIFADVGHGFAVRLTHMINQTSIY